MPTAVPPGSLNKERPNLGAAAAEESLGTMEGSRSEVKSTFRAPKGPGPCYPYPVPLHLPHRATFSASPREKGWDLRENEVQVAASVVPLAYAGSPTVPFPEA